MNILSLFAGIGGLELGLERAGLGTTRWQVEIEPFNRKVLASQWPDAERFADVRDVSAEDFPGCDVICGGFPCQDISSAGKREGIDGQRSGLWREFARLIGEIRPRIVVVENVPDLAVRGLGRVLGDLCALGYDAEWEIVSAQDAGAGHLRGRLFIIATLCHPDAQGQSVGASDAAETPGVRRGFPSFWEDNCAPVGVDDGLPVRVDRLRALGNAVVPQSAEIVGRRALRILERGAVDDDPWDLRP